MQNWYWLAVGLLLFAIEMVAPGFYLMFFGIAALLTGLVALLLPLPWQALATLFALLSVISVVVGRRWYASKEGEGSATLNRRSDALVGRRTRLQTALTAEGGEIFIDDTRWTAQGPELPAGTEVEVVSVLGSRVMVRPVS
ncbi:NfeD family protein [Permianibacter sp. IMCC34836]|uniref:NfeD family protein n=1 Tax=Permianibacter fluminis TaxID=2738515 RepID=UPI00155557C7|nr:NfeD family protein [Permianibacter fluminis]NQD36195.1 NfeD family protein [Permianibacter fluminis]